MGQITVCLPERLVQGLDEAAEMQKLSRAEIVRQSVERYLEDLDDLAVATERLGDQTDPILEWDQVSANPGARSRTHKNTGP